MKLAANRRIDLPQSEEIERARLRLERATAAFTSASEQYRVALAAVGEHRSAWMGELVVASHALSVGPRYAMDPGARRALKEAARHVIDAANAMPGNGR